MGATIKGVRDPLRFIIEKVKIFNMEANEILAKFESSKSRVITIEQSYARLKSLSLQQDSLLRQALQCVEHELYRAAHVLAWAALIDYVEQLIDLKRLRSIRPKWNNIITLQDLREQVPEAQLIDAARDLGLLSKNEAKALHGLLHRRNECAHPSDYEPGLNETLGYISEILTRLESFERRRNSLHTI